MRRREPAPPDALPRGISSLWRPPPWLFAAQTRRGQPAGQLYAKKRVARSHCGHRYDCIRRSGTDFKVRGGPPAARGSVAMPSYTIRATDKETGEVRLMKVQAGTPMTEVIKQYAALSGIDEAECRFLVGGKPLKTDKPLDEQVALHGDAAAAVRRYRRRRRGRLLPCSCMPPMG